MNNAGNIEDRLTGIESTLIELCRIESTLTELCRLLVSQNMIPPRDSMAELARKVAAGDPSALRAHNKGRQNARRFQ